MNRSTASAEVEVLYFHPDSRDVAEPHGDAFRLVERPTPPSEERGFYLWAVAGRLELRRGTLPGGVWVDDSVLRRRSAQGGELLRACGVAPGRRPEVLDAMAGWGIDGLVIAVRGGAVTMVERHPALHALELDLCRRCGETSVIAHCADSFEYLAASSGRRTGGFDVVYLDPMFPERGKGALPGKRMQWLAALTQPDGRPLALWLRAAVAVARDRVVVKRRRRDPAIAAPDWRILGRTVRYDVYRGTGRGDAIHAERFTPGGRSPDTRQTGSRAR